MSDDALGDRMKGFERATKRALDRHEIAIIRVDGRAFSQYTRGLHSNDPALMGVMWATARELCEEIQGARLAYAQSDEISVLVNPWSSPNSQAWFGNDLQKVVSVSAAIAAVSVTLLSSDVFGKTRGAQFDARAFTLPVAEANAYFVWRQLDAYRNAVNGLAQETFSTKQLHGVKLADVREMLRVAGVPFEGLPVHVQRGAVVAQYEDTSEPGTTRKRWRVEPETPWFGTDSDFVQSRCEVVKDSVRVPPAASVLP